MKLYPRHIVKWNSYHISIFSDFFRKLLIHSLKIVDNSPVFPLFFCPLIVDNSMINRVPATPFLFFYGQLLRSMQGIPRKKVIALLNGTMTFLLWMTR